jgi:hypothetical protein
MDGLAKTLAEIYRTFGARIESDPYRLRLELERCHGSDSRIPLLESAAMLGVPRRLLAGDKANRLRLRLAIERGYSREATAYAIAAWAAACGIGGLSFLPHLRRTPRESLAELVRQRLAKTTAAKTTRLQNERFRAGRKAA